jgi:hypothetical protein
MVPRSSIVSVGRTPVEHEPCVCSAPAGRRPLKVGVEYCLAGSSPHLIIFQSIVEKLEIKVLTVVGGWVTEKNRHQEVGQGAADTQLAPTSWDETKLFCQH